VALIAVADAPCPLRVLDRHPPQREHQGLPSLLTAHRALRAVAPRVDAGHDGAIRSSPARQAIPIHPGPNIIIVCELPVPFRARALLIGRVATLNLGRVSSERCTSRVSATAPRAITYRSPACKRDVRKSEASHSSPHVTCPRVFRGPP
jgi:hypothetical protein